MGDSAAAREAWNQNWQGAPLNALLPWAAQMLSLLDAPEGEALLPALQVHFLLASWLHAHLLLGVIQAVTPLGLL